MSIATTNQPTEQRRSNVPALHGPRLPYHPQVEERFGIDKASWKALVEAIFPNATTVESVILALSYCRARKLDPFKKNVHIVPIWNKDLGRMVDTVWPGIGELRTTAFRTGEYAGRSDTKFGPDITQKVGNVEMTFPEWAQVTVFRMVKSQRVEFCGPRVYWLETYATIKRTDDTPNDMWQTRPRGQIDKCAEAAALRAAFPEELGGEHIPEEVQHQMHGGPAIEGTAKKSIAQITKGMEGEPETPRLPEPSESQVEQSHDDDDDDEQQTIEADHSQPLDPDLPEAFAVCVTIKQVDELQETQNKKPGRSDAQREQVNALADKRRAEIRSTRGAGSNQGA